MLDETLLKLAIEIQAQSYQLLKWVAKAVERGVISASMVHNYADASQSAYAWIEQHYQDLPPPLCPDRRHLREFANFFATYLTSSFDIVEQPGERGEGRCFCLYCTQLVNAPHLRPKKLFKRDKEEAVELMVERVASLARESNVEATVELTRRIVTDARTRRAAGFSAYGYWLIRRMDGISAGKPVLALWREIAWTKTGAPIKDFTLKFDDIANAETSLVQVLQDG